MAGTADMRDRCAVGKALMRHCGITKFCQRGVFQLFTVDIARLNGAGLAPAHAGCLWSFHLGDVPLKYGATDCR